MQSLPHKPLGVSTYDWETDSFSYDVSQMDAQQVWRTAVALAATKARQSLPECSTRIDRALELVMNGAVVLLENGTARVTSPRGTSSTVYTVQQGACDCPDFDKAPRGFCKHRLSYALTMKAMQVAKSMGQSNGPVQMTPAALPAPQEPAQAAPPLLPPPDAGDVTKVAPEPPEPMIPPQFVVTIQHKPFVLFAGLLTLAHARGLLSLNVTFISVTSELALCAAVATFKDGSVFADVGDASPSNVNKAVAKHFPRVAATRAAARALRHGLNVNMVAFEELD